MGWLNRMTQWKDKAGKNREGASVGLFSYPVLQAADILLYNATHVPVGEDQKQHVELTRDIALKFNTDFDVDLFVPPEPFIGGGTAARVMSLRDGQSKMSKTDPSDMSRINLTDSDDADRAEDPQGEDRSRAAARRSRRSSTGGPRRRTWSGSTRAVTGESVEQVLARNSPARASASFKPALADALVALLAPLRTRLEQFRADPAELDRILAAGAERASELAAPTLAAAYRAVGLTR